MTTRFQGTPEEQRAYAASLRRERGWPPLPSGGSVALTASSTGTRVIANLTGKSACERALELMHARAEVSRSTPTVPVARVAPVPAADTIEHLRDEVARQLAIDPSQVSAKALDAVARHRNAEAPATLSVDARMSAALHSAAQQLGIGVNETTRARLRARLEAERR